MQIKLTAGTTVIFDKDGTLTEKQLEHFRKHLVYLTATPAERTVIQQQSRAAWLASLPKEKRDAILALDAMPPDEQKLEYAKLQQAALQTQLAKVESTVVAMTAAVVAKPVLKNPG